MQAMTQETCILLEIQNKEKQTINYVVAYPYSVLVNYFTFNDISFKNTDCHPFAWLEICDRM